MNQLLGIVLALCAGATVAAWPQWLGFGGQAAQSIQLPSDEDESAELSDEQRPFFSGFCIEGREAVRKLLASAKSAKAELAFEVMGEHHREARLAAWLKDMLHMDMLTRGESIEQSINTNGYAELSAKLKKLVEEEQLGVKIEFLCREASPLVQQLQANLEQVVQELDVEMDDYIYDLPCVTIQRLLDFEQACTYRDSPPHY